MGFNGYMNEGVKRRPPGQELSRRLPRSERSWGTESEDTGGDFPRLLLSRFCDLTGVLRAFEDLLAPKPFCGWC